LLKVPKEDEMELIDKIKELSHGLCMMELEDLQGYIESLIAEMDARVSEDCENEEDL
jgi:hypothetical protein